MRTLLTFFLLFCATAIAHPQPATWRRFTNSIISKIWSVPTGSQSTLYDHNRSTPGPAQSRAGRLAARYGQDIVLRFNVTTASEARALAEVRFVTVT